MIGRILARSSIHQALSSRQTVAVRHLSKHPDTASISSRPIKTSCAERPELEFKLLKDTEIEGIGSTFDAVKPAGSNVSTDDLEFELEGKKVSFNLTWLRDSCHCSECTHTHSRQRIFTPNNFKRGQFALDDIRLLDRAPEKHQQPRLAGDIINGSLFVRWADGHESLYSLDWLRNINDLYKSKRIDPHFKQRAIYDLPQDDLYAPFKANRSSPEYWSVEQINANLKPVDYEDLIDGFKFNDDEPTFINANNIEEMSANRYQALKDLTTQLTKFGIAKIINIPTERNQVLRVARSMAYERPTGYGTIFDVVIEPSEEINLAYTSQEFDLHSDLTYRETSPGVQLLHCIRNSDEGGSSYFSDAFHAAVMLKQSYPELFEVLLQFPAIFVVRDPYRNIKFRRQKTILTLNHQGNLDEVYYSPFMLPPVGFKQDVKLFYLALDKFTQLLQSKENKLITKMEPGDLFIFHNRRVLHGRSSYNSTNSNRFLQGCYMDWDEICCLHEKLIANKP